MDHLHNIGPRRRSPYPRVFKVGIIEQCCQPGASVADVAARHGLREALVYRWLAQDTVAPEAPSAAGASGQPAFVPFEPAAGHGGPGIRIELHHGPAAVTIHWPLQAATSCGAWLQGWLSS